MQYHKNRTFSILSANYIRKLSSLFIIVLFLSAVIPASVNAATSVSQYGITWTFSENYQTGQFVNGDYWVVGPVTITSISPATTVVSGRTMNGSMLNPAMGTSQGYDSSITYFTYNSSLNVARTMPLTIPAGNSLVSTISLASPFPGGSKYSLQTAAVLTVMASAPPSGTFRPSYYYGADKTAKYNWSTVQANESLLGNLNPQIDLTKPVSIYAEQYSAGCLGYTNWTGNMADFLPQIQRVWLDHRSDWSNEYLAPQDNMSDYGSNLANKLGWASLLLQSQLPAGWVKDNLLIAFVQKGIDWSGAIQHQAAGNNGWTGDGGHSIGRKWPVMFAAIMLNDTTLLNYIKAKSGDYCKAPYSTSDGFSISQATPSDAVQFAEDSQTFTVSAVDISLNRGGNYTGSPSTSYLSSDLNLPEYGMYHSTIPKTDDRWWQSNHRQVNSGTMYGAFSLAALIMGQRANWNHDAFFDYTDRFVEVSLTLQSNNAFPWKAQETVIALNMWSAYRKTYTPYWTRSNPTAVAAPQMTNAGDPSYLNGSRVGSQTQTQTPTTYTVTSSVSDGNGVVTPADIEVNSGGDQTFTATPATGYQVSAWMLDGNTVADSNLTYSLSNITANHTVSVTFQPLPATMYLVIGGADANGTISPRIIRASANSSLLFTATPDSNYVVYQWVDNGQVVQIGGTNYNLTNVNAFHRVYVTFQPRPATTYLVIGRADANGTISPRFTRVSANSNLLFTATPDSNYVINQWIVDGNVVQTEGTTYNLSNINTHHWVYVTFTLASYTITTSAGTGGTISPINPTVNCGTSQAFTATPATGYQVSAWTLDGNVVADGNLTYTLSNITAAHTVTVQFQLTGLLGDWKFDETGRTDAADSSGNNNDGTLLGGAALIGGAVDLSSAATDAVQIGLNNCDPNAGTVSLWVFPESFAARPQYLFGHATSPWSNRIQLYITGTAGNLAVGIGNNHSANANIQTIALQTWSHVALTWDGTNYIVYVNGVPKANGAYSGLSVLNNFADIGNDGYATATNEAFVGLIGETLLYNRALSATEVQNLYNDYAGSVAP